MNNKRVFQRLEIRLKAYYNVGTSGKGSWEATTTVNISPQGVRFASSKKINAGQEVELEIYLDNAEKVKIKTRAVWSKFFKAERKWHCGVQIINVRRKDESRFIKYYCQRSPFVPAQADRILIIEDEKQLVKMFKGWLSKKQNEVISAYDGQQGYELYLIKKPDLVIVDITLPHLDGFEVCRKIRRENRDHVTPILMISSKAGDVYRIRGRVIGADKFMLKPFEKQDFLDRINELLTGRDSAVAS